MRASFFAVVRRVDLWVEGVRAALAHVRRRWWTRSAVPTPSTTHLAWRRATAYGSADHPIEPDDLVAYLEWRRRQRRAVQ
jgi:hypothetical protein